MSEREDITLATYQANADQYRQLTGALSAPMLRFLDKFADLVGTGRILEIGSGPGREAKYLEARGLQVARTDATPAFVDMMRADGFAAELLDVRTDELGGPYAGVLANAVLLHLSRPDIKSVTERVSQALVPAGLLAFTLKEGDGEAWSNDKLGSPRYFTYWREPAVRTLLQESNWEIVSIERTANSEQPWINVLARTPPKLANGAQTV
ncbi:MAG: hypothetical protein JWN38_569 [Candidatus Saccharibacteria bacterium]|nr:hypothetical protein [Candidatus Saccharibacteria bacterium]